MSLHGDVRRHETNRKTEKWRQKIQVMYQIENGAGKKHTRRVDVDELKGIWKEQISLFQVNCKENKECKKDRQCG